MNTCRFCKKTSYDGVKLVKYGVRHEACVDCILSKWPIERIEKLQNYAIIGNPSIAEAYFKAKGPEGLKRFRPEEIQHLPWRAAKLAGLL